MIIMQADLLIFVSWSHSNLEVQHKQVFDANKNNTIATTVQ